MRGKFSELFTESHYILQLWNNPLIGLSIIDKNGIFTDINRTYCTILCRSYDEIIGSNWCEFTVEDDLKSDQYLADGVLEGKLQSYELRKRYKVHDDHFVEVVIGVRAIKDKEGNFVCFYTTCIPVELLIGGNNLSVSYFHDTKHLGQPTDLWGNKINNVYRVIGIILGGSAILGGILTGVYWFVKLVDLVLSKMKG